MEQEMVWLDRMQLSILFDRDVKTIGKHIATALQEELKDLPTVAIFATVQQEGVRWVKRQKEYLFRVYAINPRLEQLEKRVANAEEKIDFFVKTSLPPVEGIFFDGQIYDAYEFVCDLIRGAKTRIILIDNYIDDTVLTMLDKRGAEVTASVYTQHITKQLQLDINKHNKQYPVIEVLVFKKSHDRFLIVDNSVYLVGASLKDLGKKWFGITLMQAVDPDEMIMRLRKK